MMFFATAVVTLLVASVLASSAMNVARNEQWTQTLLERVGATGLRPILVTASMAGAIGLIAGLWWPTVGLLAGAGTVLYMGGALGAHLRVGDRNLAPPLVILALTVIASALRAATA